MSLEQPKIVFFGTGAIGGSVGAWISEKYEQVYLLDQGVIAEKMKANGVTTYCIDTPEQKTSVPVKVIDSLDQALDADVVVIGVKNYSLEAVAQTIREKLGDKPYIIGMQNGIANQRVLPKYFSKVIYCVISYNAWLDEPGVVGYQKRGPLILGTPDNSLQPEMEQIARVFNLGVETIVTHHIQDAAHNKLVINLTNSVTTLVGLKYQPISDMGIFQKLLSNTLYEGIEIVKAAGIEECQLGGMPSWRTIWMGAKLPQFISGGTFKKNVKKMVLSSMGQDILQRRNSQNELDTINGEMIAIADRVGLKAPYNRTILEICRREFAKPDFKPLDVKEVWEEVSKHL